MSRPFQAAYSGRCAADCGEPIREGDWVAFSDDELMHEDCAAADTEATRRMAARPSERRAVCTSCWLVHAGECP